MTRRAGCVLVVACVMAAMLLFSSDSASALPLAVTFAPHIDYLVQSGSGVQPDGMAVADLNGDGHLDVVTANALGNSVSMLLGSGGGAFAAHTELATGPDPESIAVADLNGDGHPDVVTGNDRAPFPNPSTVSVLLGRGDGSFAAHTDYLTATNADTQSVAVGDVNGDGHLDVVTANWGQSNVSVLLGNGDGTLAPHTDYPTGTEPESVAVGDLNGDGHLDIITADSFLLNVGVSVLLGNGDGTFTAHTDFPSGTGPRSVAVADLNGNGHLDVVTANANGKSASVLLGNGDGTLAPHIDYAIANPGSSSTAPQQVAVGDLNGDGHPDVATVDSNGTSVSVLLGNGDGTFALHTDFTTGFQPNSVAVADVDSDSRPDVVTGNISPFNPSVSVLLNTTVPTLPDPPTILRNATAGNQSATISWLAPASDGGSPIVGYIVTAYVGYAPVKVRIFKSTLTTQTVTGLTNGTEYRFRVRAWNAIGISGFSKVTNPVTPTAF